MAPCSVTNLPGGGPLKCFWYHVQDTVYPTPTPKSAYPLWWSSFHKVWRPWFATSGLQPCEIPIPQVLCSTCHVHTMYSWEVQQHLSAWQIYALWKPRENIQHRFPAESPETLTDGGTENANLSPQNKSMECVETQILKHMSCIYCSSPILDCSYQYTTFDAIFFEPCETSGGRSAARSDSQGSII